MAVTGVRKQVFSEMCTTSRGCHLCVHVLVCLLLSSRAAFCPSWTSSQCPLADNVMERFEKELTENMAGQPQAFHAIRKALARNVDSFAGHDPNPPSILSTTWKQFDSGVSTFLDPNRIAVKALDGYLNFLGVSRAQQPQGTDKPLFMHFSGPTGVGKTMTADAIARAMFKEKRNNMHELCGRLSFLMRDFNSPKSADIKHNLAEIRGKVAEQLHHCPRSVIIFDEVQALPEKLLDRVIDIFDREGPAAPLEFQGTRVNTSSCVVVAISDMGSAKLSPHMARPEAKRAVEQDAKERFVGSRKKALLNNIVPFLPLSVEELGQVAGMELRELSHRLAREYRGVWGGTITWQKHVPAWLAERCFAEASCYDDGGRGVETVVTHEVLSVVEDALLAECGGAGQGVSYNNVHIAVAEGGGELTARVDAVFAEREFKEL